jgi:ankyrin repeat protein
MAGSAANCKKIIERGANVNQRLETHRTYGSALVAAVSSKRTEVIQSLLAAGADMNMLVATKNPDRSTALSAAITAGDTDIVKCLLENGKADVNMGYPDISNDSILFKAARTGNLELIRLILEAGADVDTTFMSCSDHSGLLPQMINASNVEGVKYLVKEAKADVNKRHGKDQLYPIELAASNFLGSAGLEILEFLCREGGADVNASSSSGKYGSALAAACASWDIGHAIEAAKCLLDAGADVNTQLTAGEYGSALAVAAKESYGTEIMELLIDAGADVNMHLENGPYGNALMAAQAGDSGDYKKVAYLLQAGANMEASLKPEAYRGAITAAVLANEPERVKAMVNAGAVVDVALEDSDFGDLLAYSTILNFEEGILEALQAGGAPADGVIATGRYGTALVAAASFGQYRAAKCLINAGAIVNIETDSGDYKSPIEAAEAPFSEADKATIVKFCNLNESDARNLLKKWETQKGDVLKLLKEKREPFTTTFSICRPILTTCSASKFAVSSNPPCFVIEGPERLRSGNYVIRVEN